MNTGDLTQLFLNCLETGAAKGVGDAAGSVARKLVDGFVGAVQAKVKKAREARGSTSDDKDSLADGDIEVLRRVERREVEELELKQLLAVFERSTWISTKMFRKLHDRFQKELSRRFPTVKPPSTTTTSTSRRSRPARR
jgi:hypothetical protein